MSIKREYNFDEVGKKDMYLLHHEEIESLAKNIPVVSQHRYMQKQLKEELSILTSFCKLNGIILKKETK